MKPIVAAVTLVLSMTAYAEADGGYSEVCRSAAEQFVQECGGITEPVLFRLIPPTPSYRKTIYWYQYKARVDGRTKVCKFPVKDDIGWRCDTYNGYYAGAWSTPQSCCPH